MRTFHITCLKDNYAHLFSGSSMKARAVVVDPVELEKIIETAKQHGVNLTTVLTTHHHCHTKGHITYYVTGKEGEDPVVFTGDSLFIAGCGKFVEGSAEQMYRSLCVILGSLPKSTQVYCGHEYTVKNLQFALALEPSNVKIRQKLAWAQKQQQAGLPTISSTIEEELETNPFMRKLFGFDDPVEALREIRKRKGQLDGLI